MTVSYHITTPISEHQLIGAQRTAKAQEERVLAVFRAAPMARMSPRQVLKSLNEIHRRHGGPPAPDINSVRRAITNLTDAYALVHHEKIRIPSPYIGHSETLWQLNGSNQ